MVKRIFVIILVAVFLIGGCSPSGSETSVPKINYEDLSLPTDLEIVAPAFFYNYGDDTLTVDERNEWTDAMSERYGVYITVTVPVDTTYSSTMQEAYNQNIHGVVNVGGLDVVQYFKDGGAILPLDDYLADNPAWLSLPEEMRNMYMIDGHIWAIPSSFYYTMKTRSFRTDWLEQLGLEVPTDLDSLREYALAVANSDIEGAAIGGGADLSWALDILNAFGVRIDSSGQFGYAYDPETGTFIDGFLQSEAAEALQYLRELYEADAFDTNLWNMTSEDVWEALDNGEYGSYYTTVGEGKYGYGMYAAANAIYEQTSEWPTTDEKWNELTTLYTEITSLSNNGYEVPQILFPTGSAFVLINGTAQPAETANFFVDLLYGSEPNYIEAYVGLEDNIVRNSDGSITLKMMLDEDASEEAGEGVYVTRHMANLVGIIEGVYDSENLEIIGSDNENVRIRKQESAAYNSQTMTTALNAEDVLKLDLQYSFPVSQTLNANVSDIATAFHTCFVNAISNEDYTVQQALSEYAIAMEQLGAQQVLVEANAVIGKTPTQRY
ncbi:MAG TPA: hypothetical protein PK629_06570 [Oscillospiraceae bacterium]|nr:hypothetical protein [Oscillospiraceae bacterium]HPF55925.1 hypothetical protein [Clostridiales bacterium]HPK36119.1 hypothetical protein [Oscillospiraceae bacterium]HPR76557.1 hypothetical protein [Oscillospiraceae bacterium]